MYGNVSQLNSETSVGLDIYLVAWVPTRGKGKFFSLLISLNAKIVSDSYHRFY
jgi:hypothetical protein